MIPFQAAGPTEVTVDGITSRRRSTGSHAAGVSVVRPMVSLHEDHEGEDLTCICSAPDKRIKGSNYVADGLELVTTRNRYPKEWGDIVWESRPYL